MSRPRFSSGSRPAPPPERHIRPADTRVERLIHIELPVVFPPWNVLFALLGTLAIALLIVRIPLRRAVRLRPGDAIRYA